MAQQEQLDDTLADAATDEWPQFKSAVYNSAAKVIGFNKPRHHDWFDDHDTKPANCWTTCMPRT